MLDSLTYDQCVAQGVGPLVFPQRLAEGNCSPHENQQMKSVCLCTIQQQVQIRHVFEQAYAALEKAGIRAVVLKGVGLAALYDDPSQRVWSDIDLFVGKNQYHPACAVMRETFPKALKFDEELDHYKHYNLIADGVSIEVHRVSVGLVHPHDIRRYEPFEIYGMANACEMKYQDASFLVPEPTFNAFFVFLHAWEHMLSMGANARQLYDLTVLLHRYKDQMDQPRLKHYLQALCLMDVWQLFMAILVQHLELPQDEAPFYTPKVESRAERLWQDLLAQRLVAPKANEPTPATNRFVRKWHTMRERMANADRINTYSPAYARHMRAAILLSGMKRLFAKDRHWE